MPVSSIIVAHRGLHKAAPENSLAAFRAAVNAGVGWVECDVWPSADGVPVVIHDETLDRTTLGTGKVAEQPWDVLRQLQIPSLPEILPVLGETGILVEIKPANAREFVEEVLLQFRRHRGPWMIQSFHLENVAVLNRNIPTAFLIEDAQALDTVWQNINVDHRLIDQPLVERLHGAGRRIGAWTVNAPQDIARVVDLGIDMLITDEPELAAQIISTR